MSTFTKARYIFAAGSMAAFSIGMSQPASAQMAFDMTANMMNTSNTYLGTSAMRAANKAERRKKPNNAAPLANYVSPTTSYRPDPQVRRTVQAEFVKAMRENGAGVGRLPSPSQMMRLYGQVAARFGLPKDDIASAAALEAAVLWELANQEERFSDGNAGDKRRMAALRQQMIAAMATSPQYQKISASERQAMADRAALNAILFAMMQEQLKTPAGAAQADRIARQAMDAGQKEFRINLTDVDMTEKGLVPRNLDAFSAKYKQ